MMAWESGMPVCEIGSPPAQPDTHAHDSEPLACSNCSEFACDYHGDRSVEDDEWLCEFCYHAEQIRLAAATAGADR